VGTTKIGLIGPMPMPSDLPKGAAIAQVAKAVDAQTIWMVDETT
jgi:hypothetical protein